MLINKFIFFLILSFAISSCIPEEDPVQPYDRGDVQQNQLSESMYFISSYYNFEKSQFVKSHDKNNWDIAFYGVDSLHYVIMNWSRSAKAIKADTYDFEANIEEPDTFFIDDPLGDLNKSVFGEWWLNTQNDWSEVFVLNRGNIPGQRPFGVYKIQFQLLNKDLVFRYQNIEGGDINYDTIRKNQDYNFVYNSFQTPGVAIFNEPPRDDWDIVFTEYTDYVPYDDPSLGEEAYQVRGVLINRYNGVEAAVLTDTLDFNNVTFSDIDNINMIKDLNVIGYDWKGFSLEENTYTVFPEFNYVVKDTKGFFLKLRFTDFNNDSGVRGFPTFEYKKL